MGFVLLALAIAPAVAISVYVYLKDEYEKEPLHLLAISFALGAVSTVPALLLELWADRAGFGASHDIAMTTFHAFVVVAGSEELCKYLFVRLFAYPRKDFNEPFDGIAYAVMVAMGFAAVENLAYALGGGVRVLLVRMFTAVPQHAAAGVLMGYFVGLAKFSDRPVRLHLAGLLSAIALHGAYDFFLIQSNYPGLLLGAIVSLCVGLTLAMRAIRLHNLSSPFRELARTEPPVEPESDA